MPADALSLVAQELGLTLVEDGEDGCARAVVGEAESAPLLDVVARMGGLSPDDSTLCALIEGARAGVDGSLAVDRDDGPAGRIVAIAAGGGRARALFVPRAGAGSVVRRAAAADLAAGVTHEVANALTAIAGWAQIATSSGPLPERARQALDVVERSARSALASARSLLAKMRDTGRTSILPGPPQEASLAEAVLDAIEALRPELDRARVRIEPRIANDVRANVPIGSAQLIVANLVRNSLEALRDQGGKIRVTLEGCSDEARLCVEDDGPGMSHRTLARAFDRYFTTKAEGTGLGLALVREAVYECGGRLEVDTAPGRGTRFEILLPAGGATSLRPPPFHGSSGVHSRPGAPMRVLVVDDDSSMRSMIGTALELQGAQVDGAEGCGEALSLPGPFDVALVDLSLGDGQGDDLIAQLRALERITHAVLLTGSAEPVVDPAGAPDAVLHKPFELEELLRAIAALTQSSARRAEA